MCLWKLLKHSMQGFFVGKEQDMKTKPYFEAIEEGVLEGGFWHVLASKYENHLLNT